MTIQEAQAELDELRGLAAQGVDLAPYRARVARLYRAVCRKALRECNCRDVLPDALIEIYVKLKNTDTTMNELKSSARLVNGVVLQVGGTHYTNANLTDDVARKFLAEFPQRADWFAVLPNADKGEETASEVVEPKNEPTAQPKKKTPRKRK